MVVGDSAVSRLKLFMDQTWKSEYPWESAFSERAVEIKKHPRGGDIGSWPRTYISKIPAFGSLSSKPLYSLL